jgi:glycosyltransferase involved in cell wall biosynthesis
MASVAPERGDPAACGPATVSAIVPVFNGERYLAQALRSVRDQTYRPLEIIVVDDGSTDRSADVAQEFGEVRYAFQPHTGLGAALNRGVSMARGAFLAFIDADDLWPPHKLAVQLACFARDSSLDIVFGYIQPFYDAPARAAAPSPGPMSGYSKGTMLVTASAFHRVGAFNPSWRVGDFVDWYVRARECGLTAVMLPEVLLMRRIHADNMGRRERARRTDYLRILKQALDRRTGRAGAPPAAGGVLLPPDVQETE